MTTKTAKTAALKQAATEVLIRPFNGQYQVVQYDPAADVWREGNLSDYWHAREWRAASVATRAAVLMGLADDPSDIQRIEYIAQSTKGSARERLDEILAR
jgi:hypothetical protein